MHEKPPLPEEMPAVPRGRLWASLLLPPAATGVLTAFLACLTAPNYGSGAFGGLVLGLSVIIACLVIFLGAILVRYEGRSVPLLGSGFVIGEVVICFAVWFATCLLFLD